MNREASAAEPLKIRAAYLVSATITLCLNHQAGSLRSHRDHIGTEIPRTSNDPNVQAAISFTQVRKGMLEFFRTLLVIGRDLAGPHRLDLLPVSQGCSLLGALPPPQLSTRGAKPGYRDEDEHRSDRVAPNFRHGDLNNDRYTDHKTNKNDQDCLSFVALS
ncbi:MAG TPA: hypothetical protein VGP70_12790 [Actinomadura sp.]|nr:hypothetical protein [Actinomadura sp.]